MLKDIFLSEAALTYCNNFCCFSEKVLLFILPRVPILPLPTLYPKRLLRLHGHSVCAAVKAFEVQQHFMLFDQIFTVLMGYLYLYFIPPEELTKAKQAFM